jgi:magnesium-transporting ATPase (P-type)
MNWFLKSKDEVLKFYNVDLKLGLNENQIKESRLKFGENKLPEPKQIPWYIILFEQFNNPIIYILIIAAILNGLIAEPKDAFVIGVVVILNTLLGFYQEKRASKALNSLKEMTAPIARVIRDGELKNINSSEVVCGDIISLESGMRVPADARLVETYNLLVNESMLTGEAIPIFKDENKIIKKESVIGDRINQIYGGTIIQKGRALAVVTAVGTNTEFGNIAKTVEEAIDTQSPLQEQIAGFGKTLSILIIAAVLGIFLVGLLRDIHWVKMLLTAVGLAVSAIPEGLPVSVTITLSIGVFQMAKHKSIVRKLAAVETLGSTNFICTDKTGTLTKNQMIANYYYIGNEEYIVSGSGYEIKGSVNDEQGNQLLWNSSEVLEYASLISAICTESNIVKEGEFWKITGDPTEAALMIAADKLDFNPTNIKSEVSLPFESENQLMAVNCWYKNKKYVLVKGAPEMICKRSKHLLLKDSTFTPFDINDILFQASNYSNQGLRVLAIAFKEISEDFEVTIEELNNLNLVGLVGIEDSVRQEAVEAVKNCNDAGIKVVMITGDHISTAKAVAKTVGIGAGKPNPTAINGTELDNMTDEDLYLKVKDIDVYARVAPNHKYRIVKQLQAHNQVVAMTGDGVNDAPALKQADIGVAMGSGTDVAREASHMILLDDNFATIVNAVRRGRVVLKNLQHILMYILSTSFGGVLTIATSVAIGFPLPILPAQLLWINMVTDGSSTFPLAFEKEHGNVMLYPPRRKSSPLINKSMLLRMILSGIFMMIGTLGLFYYYSAPILGIPFEDIVKNDALNNIYLKAQTIAFTALAFFQIWNVQNSRSVNRSLFFRLPGNLKSLVDGKLDPIGLFNNNILLGVMLLAVVLQVAAVELPFMNNLLNTESLSLNEWLLAAGIPLTIIAFVEILKFVEAVVINKKLRKEIAKENQK